MLPISHAAPMNAAVVPPTGGDGMLADAFSVFVSAANRLERSYRQLHDEVAQLRTELEERNRALASSLEENARMKILHSQILDELPCGVAVVDSQRNEIVLLNPEARKLLGIATTSDKTWDQLPASLLTMIDSGPTQAWRQGDESEIAVSDRWLRVRCTAIEGNGVCTAANDFPAVILTFRDTTLQKQADEKREASRQMVALAEISTVLAHEIRNPLGSLELFASLLAADGNLCEQSREWTRHLQAGVRALAATVNNVLRFHIHGSVQRVPLNLRELLRNGIEFVRPLGQQAGVAISLEEELGEIEVMADSGALQQVFLNLAHNAFRHSQAGGSFRIRAWLAANSRSRMAIVEFSDTGSGIRPEDLPHIFEAGFSGHHQSTGLGLAVCRRIVLQHQGVISAISKLGEGSTFHMELPVL
jgi:two-component system sensor histidine kinase FlrB